MAITLSGSLQISGSLTADSITGSIFGTASYALSGAGGGPAFPFNGSAEISGSLTLTGSFSTDRDASINLMTVGKGGGNVINNISVGYKALACNPYVSPFDAQNYNGMSRNIAVGHKALYLNGSYGNTYGYGHNNTAIGYKAMMSGSQAYQNVAIGSFSQFCSSLDEHSFNVSVGNYTLCNGIRAFANAVVGHGAMRYSAYGSLNSVLGAFAMYQNYNGSNNVAIGVSTLSVNCNGSRNIAIGSCALRCSINTNNNVAVGDQALQYNVSGCNNTVIGAEAGRFINGNGNIVVGQATGIFQANENYNISIVTGNTGIFITGSNGLARFYGTGGVSASCFIGDGSQLTGISANAFPYTGSAEITGSLTLTGSFSTDRDASINSLTVGRGGGNIATNTAIGSGSLVSNTSGANNIAVGNSALRCNTTGCSNIAVGLGALSNNTTGDKNTAVGTNALVCNTYGCRNTAVGHRALNCNTVGLLNTAVGNYALYFNYNGCHNTAVGVSALSYNTTGYNNTAVGNCALFCNTYGFRNTAVGYQAGYCIQGSNNVVLGGFQGTVDFNSQDCNIFISDGAGNLRMLITGSTGYVSASGFIGDGSQLTGITGGGSVATTGSTLYSTNPLAGPNLNPDNNIFLGYGSGENTGLYVVCKSNFIGYQSGKNAKDVRCSNIIGHLAFNATGNNHYAIGSDIIGYKAGWCTNTGFSNSVVIGKCAGSQTIYRPSWGGANDSVLIGNSAGKNNYDTTWSVIIGGETGADSCYAANSIMLGFSSGVASCRMCKTSAIGWGAGAGSICAYKSTFIGTYTGESTRNVRLSNFIGTSAGSDARCVRNTNSIGTYAGQNANSASFSTFIGYKAGFSKCGIFTNQYRPLGVNNIIIGTNITLPSGSNSSMNIGATLFGSGFNFDTGSFQCEVPSGTYLKNPITGSVGGRIGINVVVPEYNFDVSGSSNFRNTVIVSGSSSFINPVLISGSLGITGSVTVVSGSLAVGNIVGSATVGRIDASNDIVAFSTSDRRYKTNVTRITNAIEKIKSVSGIKFDWIEDSQIHGNSGPDVGVIAQEIEAVLPEVVTTRETGIKAVKYEKIVPLLIEAIKEQQEEIDSLKKQLKQI